MRNKELIDECKASVSIINEVRFPSHLGMERTAFHHAKKRISTLHLELRCASL